MEFLIVSGLSGAGKSTVMSILEDSGYFCVDNLPPVLIPKFAEVCLAGAGSYERVAMVCDIRGGENFDGLFEAMDALRAMEFQYKVLFVDAEDAVIIKRYKETRRSHPLLAEMGGLAQAVERERAVMAPVRARADYIINTTTLPVRKLRGQVLDMFAPNRKSVSEMSVTLTSFGFKYGLPLEADLVFDVRFLPNPFYIDELRPQTGLDQGVADHALDNPAGRELLERLRGLMDFLLPHFVEEGKSALVIAIGCTGGRHRSVAVTHALTRYIQSLGYAAGETHRDMTRA
ncbi:MAG: RNase adapter RapZ [Oscillospiraceae bacterium]|nr:RNase adapter RapZ [Oscillospiraceae bacterium]MCI8807951.1 RNase adapter RapZ [Oscillospiraceae bacterium]MCI9308993.1 RNase adapter RapZ [Oscillospiraceae bacterium]MCI9548528.1 RNase adapter RapZ [Oscillospiraceae bacterium]